MEIGSTTPQQAGAAPRTDDDGDVASAASTLASDFNTFLTLLTAQMRNQDPLSPIESNEFVNQLATFSSVEQQIAANDKLDAIADALGGEDINSLGAWLGKGVEVRTASVEFTGDPLRFTAPEQGAYDAVDAAIIDENGDVVRTMELSGTDQTYTWDGLDDSGDPAAGGTYTIDLVYANANGASKTEKARLYDDVAEVRLTDEGWRLQLAGGRTISLEDITAAIDA